MSQYSFQALLVAFVSTFLAPALVSAAAFPWPGPQPTLYFHAAGNSSPAPTEAPDIGHVELFKRSNDNTCGYFSLQGRESSLICNPQSGITATCAVNNQNQAHGCCGPDISACVMPTACIPQTFINNCDQACLDNKLIAKCTGSTATECYEWRYVYGSSTVYTEHGCIASARTLSIFRSLAMISTTTPPRITTPSTTSTSTLPPSTTSTTSSTTSTPTTTPPSPENPTPISAIVGGTIGGLAVLAAITFGAIYFIQRSKRDKREAAARLSSANQPFASPMSNETEHKPQSGYFDLAKAWQHRRSGSSGFFTSSSPMSPSLLSPLSPMTTTPQSPGQQQQVGGSLRPGCVGIAVAETEGREIPVEAP